MNIKFNKIHIHHFLSFDDAEISLSNRGYCLINGTNNCLRDAAKSNGCGKSTLFNALCWALTGETIQGLKNNVANIYFDDGCYVELNFSVDKDNYKIIRYKGYQKIGNDLKICINGEDKSGKGIRDSETLLAQYLPDLTSDLIGSVIILGQGFPHKFSSNTPAGRKEVLETLSKSDYMINDLKQRIDNRYKELSDKIRVNDDNLLVAKTELNIYNDKLKKALSVKEELNQKIDFESKIKELEDHIITLSNHDHNWNLDLEKSTKEKDEINNNLLQQAEVRTNRLNQVAEQYNNYNNELRTQLVDENIKYNTLKAEITRLDSIQDICPTCGRPFEGIVKPDTTSKKKELSLLSEIINTIKKDIADNDNNYKAVKQNIENKYIEATTTYKGTIQTLTKHINDLNLWIKNNLNSLNTVKEKLTTLKKDQENYKLKIKENEALIKEIDDNIKALTDKLADTDKQKQNNQNHLNVINKMNSLIKRDFRGFLLSGVIDFINKRAKEYCVEIFNTDNIELILNGNNIDINFCNKAYENLSGGEKTRIDIIIQFALKNMIETFCNFSSNILVLDEITDYLDAVSCDKVFQFISKKALTVDSMFIISHHTDELNLPYDNIINIVKDGDGVSSIHE